MTVDLTDVTFMHCNGFETLMAAPNSLIQRQDSLEIRNAQKQTARLLGLVDGLAQGVRGSAE